MTFFRFIKIDRYIFWVTILSTLGALILLSIIESFFTFLNELQNLGEDGYEITNMLLFLAYDTPARMHRIFPMALLLGCLLGLGQLSSNNELTAIRTAGLSKFRTIYGAIVAALLLSFLMLIVGEYLIPITKERAYVAQQSSSTKQVKGKGFWAITNEQIVNVGSVVNGELMDITLYQIKDQRIEQYITADKAMLQKKNWIMPLAYSTKITDTNLFTTPHPQLILATLIDKNALSALSATPDSLSMKNLWRFIRYLDKNGLDSDEYRLAFWSKLFNPIMNLTMLLIAAPLVFAQQRQHNIGTRLVIGIIIGLIIYLATQMLGHFILFSGYAPIMGAILPTLLALGIAFALFKLFATQ